MGALFDVGGGGASEFFFSAFDVRRGGRGGGMSIDLSHSICAVFSASTALLSLSKLPVVTAVSRCCC